jgi:hypothetical protein
MNERRKTKDRRTGSQKRGLARNRRNRPDRRLNSIAVEWIPLEVVHAHPLTRKTFQKH